MAISENGSANFHAFLNEAERVIDDMDGTDLSEQVLKEILETAATDMRLEYRNMTLDPRDPTQNPAMIMDEEGNKERPFLIQLSKDFQLTSMSVGFAQQMNGLFNYGVKNRKIDDEQAKQMFMIPHILDAIAALTREYVGKEGVGVTAASLLQSYKQEKESTQVKDARVSGMGDDAKEELIGHFLGDSGVKWGPEGKQQAGEFLLGKKPFERRQAKNEGDADKTIHHILQVLKQSKRLQRAFLEKLKEMTSLGDKALVDTFVRQGTRTLVEHTSEVSNYEWMQMMNRQHKELEQRPDVIEKLTATPEKAARLAKTRQEIADYLAKHEKTAEEQLRPLREVIPGPKYRQRLKELYNIHDPMGYTSLQKEIIHAVTGVVTRYHAQSTMDKDASPPSVMGLPTSMVKTKEASCFGGPWMIAAMLEYCGIDPENLFYCNVQRTHDGTIGGHGSIFLTTKMINMDAYGEAIFVDHGYSMSGRTLPLQICESSKMFSQVRALFMKKTTDPVTLRFEEDKASYFDVHNHMQVMPLYTGLSTGHLLHVGLNFLKEEKIDEAEYAFELGLSFNKIDPDLLYNLGIVHFKNGDLSEARHYLQRALNAFPDHVQSEYSLGEIEQAEGKSEKAKARFARIATFKREKIYGEKAFYDRAKQFAEAPVGN